MVVLKNQPFKVCTQDHFDFKLKFILKSRFLERETETETETKTKTEKQTQRDCM